MREARPVLVIGGTRGTGLLIARLLQRRGCTVRVLARNRWRALSLFDRSVDVVSGDITKSDTLVPAVEGVCHIVFTAGCRSGYPARESLVKMTEYEGVVNALNAALQCGFGGRFLYMTSTSGTTPSLAATYLNLWKGNTLVWRRRAEEEIRARDLSYTIIRTGILLNRTGGQHALEVTQRDLPLSLRFRIARADVAEVFLAALENPKTARTTFEVTWGQRGQLKKWSDLFRGLMTDDERCATREAGDRRA